ncbi:sialidase family protein [Actinomyces timonensis]|uniref:exo-alpha-sialidase n=1 Tax=Actinomyces timonensis TaxID=1288391 RepID=A0AAU8N656_9ACTO
MSHPWRAGRVERLAVLAAPRGADGAPAGSLRVPALLARPGGDLLLVHDLRPRPDGDAWRSAGGALPDDLPNPNRLFLRRSGDGGATWDEPVPLDPDPAVLPGITGISDPSLIAAPDGALHLLAAAGSGVGLFGARPPRLPWSRGEPPEPGTMRLLHAVSSDEGATWRWRDATDAALPSARWPDGAVLFPVSGHGIATPAGLVQPVVVALAPREDGSRPLRSACLLSSDGAAWRLGDPVPLGDGAAASLAGGAATSGTDEHAVAPATPAGDLLVMSARDASYGGTRLESTSVDGGMTWARPEAVPALSDPGCNAGMAGLPDGSLLLSHSSDPAARRAGRLSTRGADGQWRALAGLTGPDEPFGYSDLVILPGSQGAPGEPGPVRALVAAEEPGADESATRLAILAIDLR